MSSGRSYKKFIEYTSSRGPRKELNAFIESGPMSVEFFANTFFNKKIISLNHTERIYNHAQRNNLVCFFINHNFSWDVVYKEWVGVNIFKIKNNFFLFGCHPRRTVWNSEE